MSRLMNAVVALTLIAAPMPAMAKMTYRTTVPCTQWHERCELASHGTTPFPSSRCDILLQYALKTGVWASVEARAAIGLGPYANGSKFCTK